MKKYNPENKAKKSGVFSPAGTLMFGKSMLSKLPYELELMKIIKPVMLAEKKNLRKAGKAAAIIGVELISVEKLTAESRTPDVDCDCLILAGNHDFVSGFSEDPKPRVWVMLSDDDLQSFRLPLTAITAADSIFISSGIAAESFLEKFASSVSDGLASHPGGIKVPRAFMYSCRTRVSYGDDNLEELAVFSDSVSMKKPLILTDKGIIAAGLLKKVENVLEKYDIKIFDEIPPDSSSDTVNRISRIYRELERDGIIAVGGGSVLDTGKGVYMNISLGGEDLSMYAGSNRLPDMRIPFAAVPTTSGTGSEVTKVAVVSDAKRGRKMLYVSPKLQPDFAVLDSRMTASLPVHLTSITGMDALSHAVEAYTCLGKNPVSDQMAWSAIELIRDNLIPVISDPENLELRRGLALASNMAGQAFSNSMVGMVHTIGHSVGAVCHAPHGSCMSVLLPAALEYNYPEIHTLLAELLPALAGAAAAEALPFDKRARETISCIRQMNRKLKELTDGRHPCRLGDIVDREGRQLVKRIHFGSIAETSLGDASIVYNPVELRIPDIHKVLEQSY